MSSPNFSQPASSTRASGHSAASWRATPMRARMSSRLSSRRSAVISAPLAPRHGWRSKRSSGVMRISTCARPMLPLAMISDAVGAVLPQRIGGAFEFVPCRPAGRRSAAVRRCRSWQRSCALTARAAERGRIQPAREALGSGAADDRVLADLDPGAGREFASLAGNAEAKPAGYAAPAQHGMRGQRARQARRIHPGLPPRSSTAQRNPTLLHRPRSGGCGAAGGRPRRTGARAAQSARQAAPAPA